MNRSLPSLLGWGLWEEQEPRQGLSLGLGLPLLCGLSHPWAGTRPGGTSLVTIKKEGSATGAPSENPRVDALMRHLRPLLQRGMGCSGKPQVTTTVLLCSSTAPCPTQDSVSPPVQWGRGMLPWEAGRSPYHQPGGPAPASPFPSLGGHICCWES